MPKKYQLKIQPQAEADLEKIYQYIVHDKPVAAHQFIRGLKSQINSLKTFPLRGSAFQKEVPLGPLYPTPSTPSPNFWDL